MGQRAAEPQAGRCLFVTGRSVIQRVLVYGILTFGGIAVSVLVASWLADVLPRQMHAGLPVLGAGVGALFFASAHSLVRRTVRQLLYGKPIEPNSPLERFAQRLEGSLDPDAVLSAIVEVVVKALRPRYVAIHLKRLDADGQVLVARQPAGSDEAAAAHNLAPAIGLSADPARANDQSTGQLSFPLIYQSEMIGQLVVVPDEGRPMTPQDQELLATIARRAGSAAHVVRQAHDLRLARERLVLAREEERRRLRRNLHDTIGPTLAALSLKAGAVRAVIEHDPAAAQEEMTELRKLIQSVITDIRRLAYDLRPPALDELGMLPAILEQARQFSTGRLQVSVDAPDQLPALPAALEVAVYRIVMEALTNVQRHSQARHCRIRLSANDPIHIEVTDDGVGLPAEYRAGVGIASMRERATELGGFCTIESQPEGGARVVACLPLGSRVQRRDAEPASPWPADPGPAFPSLDSGR